MGKPRKQSKKLDLLIAHHEAGHAVAAYLLRRRFTAISIDPGYGAAWGYIKSPRLEWRAFRELKGAFYKRKPPLSIVEREIMISLAGDVAGSRFEGRKNIRLTPNNPDYKNALRLATRHPLDEKPPEDQLLWLAVLINLEFNVYWPVVETLADALIKERVIPYQRVRVIISDAIDRFKKPQPPKHIRRFVRKRGHKGGAL